MTPQNLQDGERAMSRPSPRRPKRPGVFVWPNIAYIAIAILLGAVVSAALRRAGYTPASGWWSLWF